jgi:mannose-1-phosphate guanylyltransferase/mannose-1-phosphate guanylyltransferase/mannose-6-phosphate isomerase
MKIRPIILSGGSGTRLWPVSRTKAPKQFVPLVGPDSLFVLTAQSGRDAALFASPMVVGNHEHKFLIQDGLDHAAITASSILLEPNGRNTAAAALVAALAETDHDTLHLVRPSDHLIADLPAFHKAVIQAAPAAASGLIVLFGITPEYAETGFGYIQTGDMTAFDNIAVIKAFKEKPDTATASALIQSGALWKYAQQVGDAEKGAVTHPGAKAETHVYADI